MNLRLSIGWLCTRFTLLSRMIVAALAAGTILWAGFPAAVATTPTPTPTPAPIPVEAVEAAPLEDAMSMIEGMSTEEMTALFEGLSTSKGAAMMAKMEVGEAAMIVDGMASAKAADIMATMEQGKASLVFEQVGRRQGSGDDGRDEGRKGCRDMGGMAPSPAGVVFEAAPVELGTEIVEVLPENTLIPRLPEVSAPRLWQMPFRLLARNLPSVPAEHLSAWERPEVASDLPQPELALTTETTSIYLLPEARQDQWALVVGSPAPIETMWARFTRPRSDVGVMVRDLGVSPEGTPEGLVANTFFSVGIENATPEDISGVAAIVSVKTNWLEANQVHKWAIQFNRLDDQAGRWVPHSSKRIREDQERVLFAVVVPSFSTLAIAGSPELPEQHFLVSDSLLDPRRPFQESLSRSSPG